MIELGRCEDEICEIEMLLKRRLRWKNRENNYGIPRTNTETERHCAGRRQSGQAASERLRAAASRHHAEAP